MKKVILLTVLLALALTIEAGNVPVVTWDKYSLIIDGRQLGR